jgi:hypothetical protein
VASILGSKHFLRGLDANQRDEVVKYQDRMFYAALDEGFDTKKANEMALVAAKKKARELKKRHSNPDEAESIAKGFHGRAVSERFEIEEEELYSDSFAVLGCLVELNITRDGGKTAIPIKGFKTPLDPKYKKGDEVYVAAPDRNNIEFVGGDQKIVNADKLAHVTNKRLICLGQVESIVYLADKHHLVGSSGKEEEYEHTFGKKRWFLFGKRGGRPDLLYDVLNAQLKLVGGTYTVTDEGIKD